MSYQFLISFHKYKDIILIDKKIILQDIISKSNPNIQRNIRMIAKISTLSLCQLNEQFIETGQNVYQHEKNNVGIQMQFEGAQSCTSEVKLQQENVRRTQGEPDSYSRQSEANWNIHSEYLRQQGNQDNRSVRSGMSSSTNRSRPPNQEDLCKAIMSLRTKLPNRSLQQILIRLYQSIEYKRKADSISSASRSRKNYEPSVCSRKDDFDDSKSYVNTVTAHNNEEFKQQPGSAGQTSLKRSQTQMKKFASQQNPSQQHQPSMDAPYIPQAKANYIYRPLGQQVVIDYTEQRTRKVNFINQQEEDRYLQRRVMAKSFIEKGYGVSECRKEIQQQNLSIKMHRNTYKTLAGSVIILAFRKLQSFIANECSKTIKNLDRWQMRSICTTMLNCRTNMQPQQMDTLFKYIKASYGLGDVTIGEIQSVKLYLAIQKNIHGKKVTMEDLERIGEIQQKKTIELTHEYLNRKKVKREQRLQKLRKLRIQVKDQKRKQKDQNKQETYRRLSEIDLNPPQLKLQADNIETTEGNSQNSHAQREPSVSNVSYSQGKEAQSRQQMYWQQSFDSQLAQLYLESKQMLKAITILQQRHSQLTNWSIELFEKRFGKLIKKSIKKVQIQSQMSGDSQLPVLNKLEKQQIRRLIYSPTPNAETVRNYLLGYFLLDDPDLEKLIEVVAITNIFFYGSALGGTIGEKRKGRGRPTLNRRQPYRLEKDSAQIGAQNGYFLRQDVQYTDEINFDEDFSLVDQEIRKSLDEDLSSFNGDLDLDIDINDLRLQMDDADPSSHPSEVSSDVKQETLSQNSFR